jgi:hypothetical protein
MKIGVDKRLVVGTISTLVGRYSLLDLEPVRYRLSPQLRESGALSFFVVDEEGFSNWITVRGDFLIVPIQVPALIEVKKTESEAISVSPIPVDLSVE